MKKLLNLFFENELLAYLFFGVATTAVSILARISIYSLTHQELLATALANVIGILFAFFTNDSIVFRQKKAGKITRFGKFVLSRLSTFLLDLILTFLFVTRFPEIIGQFVHYDIDAINTIETLFAQVSIIVLNYIFSKCFIFTKKI